MLALLYDVHGNLPALEAVLADAQQQGAESYVLGGDYVAFGGWPKETLERLRQIEHAHWIRGNTDRWLQDSSDLPPDVPQQAALVIAREQLDPEDILTLGALPEHAPEHHAYFCHASPLNDMESFGPDAHPDEDRLLNGVTEPRVVFGHTHVQFSRAREDGIRLINPGSVGMPLDGDTRASYALMSDQGTTFRRVAYDHVAAAEHTRAFLGGQTDAAFLFSRRILTAQL